MGRLRGGISKKQLKAIKAKGRRGGKIHFNGLVLILMNTENPRTGKPYTQEEAKKIANMQNKKYVHNFPYNGGNRPKR